MVANFWFMEAAIWSCKLLMERFTAGIERGHIYYVINYCTYDPDWDVTYGGPSESTSQRSARIILNLSPLPLSTLTEDEGTESLGTYQARLGSSRIVANLPQGIAQSLNLKPGMYYVQYRYPCMRLTIECTPQVWKGTVGRLARRYSCLSRTLGSTRLC